MLQRNPTLTAETEGFGAEVHYMFLPDYTSSGGDGLRSWQTAMVFVEPGDL
jgi:hypothetical protein